MFGTHPQPTRDCYQLKILVYDHQKQTEPNASFATLDFKTLQSGERFVSSQISQIVDLQGYGLGSYKHSLAPRHTFSTIARPGNNF